MYIKCAEDGINVECFPVLQLDDHTFGPKRGTKASQVETPTPTTPLNRYWLWFLMCSCRPTCWVVLTCFVLAFDLTTTSSYRSLSAEFFLFRLVLMQAWTMFLSSHRTLSPLLWLCWLPPAVKSALLLLRLLSPLRQRSHNLAGSFL